MVGGNPLSHHEAQSSCIQELSSKTSLECKEVIGDPSMAQSRGTCNARVEGSNTDSDVEFQNSMEDLPPGNPAASIAVQRLVPTTIGTTSFTRLTIPTEHTILHASQNLESAHPVVSLHRILKIQRNMVLQLQVTF